MSKFRGKTGKNEKQEQDAIQKEPSGNKTFGAIKSLKEMKSPIKYLEDMIEEIFQNTGKKKKNLLKNKK